MDPIWQKCYEPGVPPHLEYPDITLPDFLSRSARTHPRRPMTIFAGRGLSYAEVDGLAAAFARGLGRLGIGRGDRVAVMLPNCPQFPIAFHGVLRAGAVAVPVNPLYRRRDLAGILRDSGARALVTLTKLYPAVQEVRAETPLEHAVVAGIKEYLPAHLRLLFILFRERREGHSFPPRAEAIPFQEVLRAGRAAGGGDGGPAGGRPGPGDLAVLQHTGGTTGTPKAAMLTHRNLVANAMQAIAWFPSLRYGEEVFAAVLPPKTLVGKPLRRAIREQEEREE